MAVVMGLLSAMFALAGDFSLLIGFAIFVAIWSLLARFVLRDPILMVDDDAITVVGRVNKTEVPWSAVGSFVRRFTVLCIVKKDGSRVRCPSVVNTFQQMGAGHGYVEDVIEALDELDPRSS